MTGLPADDQLRPPDLSIIDGNLNLSIAPETMVNLLSTSSQLREEVIHAATLELKMDESRRNYEKGKPITGQDVQANRELGRIWIAQLEGYWIDKFAATNRLRKSIIGSCSYRLWVWGILLSKGCWYSRISEMESKKKQICPTTTTNSQFKQRKGRKHCISTKY